VLYNVVEMKRSSDKPLLAALPHIACCGGPLLIIAVVAGAVSLVDVAIALAALGAVVLAAVLWLRRGLGAVGPVCRAGGTRESSASPKREVSRLAAHGHDGPAPAHSGSLPARNGTGAGSTDEAPRRRTTRPPVSARPRRPR
jgi:hypothetical protein